MRTGVKCFGCNVSYSLRLYFALVVLSDFNVTKPYVLCHKSGFSLVTILVSVKLRIDGVLLSRFTLNKKKSLASFIFVITW